MYRNHGQLVYSPSDLIRFMESPFSSWMDRYNLEFPGQLIPDEDTAEEKLIQDILFVAPYNMQVRRLREALGPGARVGSVDKFQGQEADIVILSMCSSFGHYGSRGLEFILDQNRLNVALSRARILAVVVGDPRIASTPCHTIDSMRRVNLYCRLSRGLSETRSFLQKATKETEL